VNKAYRRLQAELQNLEEDLLDNIVEETVLYENESQSIEPELLDTVETCKSRVGPTRSLKSPARSDIGPGWTSNDKSWVGPGFFKSWNFIPGRAWVFFFVRFSGPGWTWNNKSRVGPGFLRIFL